MRETDHALGFGPRSTLAWVLIFAALAFGFYGARPLADPDEGRYAEVAREMLAGGDWLVPHLQGKVHLTKPPLTYWASAIGMRVLGQNAWGARLFTAAAFFGVILITVALARRWGLTVAQSRAAGLVFGSSLLPFLGGHILTTDMMLTFWTTLGVLCAWQAWRGEGAAWPWRWGFWIAFGMAFLTKGPPGLIPLLVIALFCLMRFKEAPRARVWSWAGLIAMLAVASWWYLALVIRARLETGSWSMARYFVIDEFYERIFTNEHQRNNSFLIYVYSVVLGIAPWVFLWPGIVGRAWRRRGNFSDAQRFAIIWFVVPYVIFTLARSRMYLYIVPLFVPIAIWAGRLLPEWVERMRRWPWAARAGVAAVALAWVFVLFAIAVWPEWAPGNRSQIEIAREIKQLNPRPFKTLYCLDEPELTLSFYLGERIIPENMGDGRIMLFLDYERRNGRPSAIEIKKKDLHDVTDDLSKIRILAENKEFMVIMPVENYVE
ncbi:glycosyltransferase family 39 protein [bacterium]|nr:glycosyltransferase family 39 protein [bacterium]